MMTPSSEESVPLPFEVNIPKERLPDVLDVYDKHASALLRITIPLVYNVNNKNAMLIIPAGDPARLAEYRSWEKFLARRPIKFVRKYPVHGSTRLNGEGIFISAPPSSSHMQRLSKGPATLDQRTTGQLDLSRRQNLGTSNHSNVFLAPLTLPSHAETYSQCGEVAVKVAKGRWEDRDMLENEAIIYDKFPCDLQESTPSSPPIVPKFFGYYVPSCESVDSYKGDDGNEEDACTVRRDVSKLLKFTVSPILMLEHCGKPVDPEMLDLLSIG